MEDWQLCTIRCPYYEPSHEKTCFAQLISAIVFPTLRVQSFYFLDPKLRGERTGLVVRALDSGSGDPGSILGRVGVLFP